MDSIGLHKMPTCFVTQFLTFQKIRETLLICGREELGEILIDYMETQNFKSRKKM